MLSMNKSTSRFCSSRKYSAMVKPVSPTRRRAPGISPICPKTRAVFSKQHDRKLHRRFRVANRKETSPGYTSSAEIPAIMKILLSQANNTSIRPYRAFPILLVSGKSGCGKSILISRTGLFHSHAREDYNIPPRRLIYSKGILRNV